MRRIAILLATLVLGLTVVPLSPAHAETQIINTSFSAVAPTARLYGDSHHGFYAESWSFSTNTLGPSPVLAGLTGGILRHISNFCGPGGLELRMFLDDRQGSTLATRTCLPDLVTTVGTATGRWADAQGSTTAAKLTLLAPLDQPLIGELPPVPGLVIPFLSCRSQYDCTVADPFVLAATLTVTV
jgi:hypothetical protein